MYLNEKHVSVLLSLTREVTAVTFSVPGGIRKCFVHGTGM